MLFAEYADRVLLSVDTIGRPEILNHARRGEWGSTGRICRTVSIEMLANRIVLGECEDLAQSPLIRMICICEERNKYIVMRGEWGSTESILEGIVRTLYKV